MRLREWKAFATWSLSSDGEEKNVRADHSRRCSDDGLRTQTVVERGEHAPIWRVVQRVASIVEFRPIIAPAGLLQLFQLRYRASRGDGNDGFLTGRAAALNFGPLLPASPNRTTVLGATCLRTGPFLGNKLTACPSACK